MKSILFLLVILGCLANGSPCLALEVTFLESAEVSGDLITVGDIALLSDTSPLAQSLAAQIIGQSPDPGQTQAVDSRLTINRLISQNKSLLSVLWQGAATVLVTRSSVNVSSNQILTEIENFLQSRKHQLPEADIRFIPDQPPLPFVLPVGTISWQVVPSSPGIIDSTRFSLICSVDGKVRKNFSVLGRVEALAPTVVATRSLHYGDFVTPDSLTVQIRDLSRATNPTANPDTVIGAVVKRTIQSGSVVDTSAVEQPPVIAKGTPVKIVFSIKHMVVTAVGIAKSDGRLHDVIRVQNSSSNKLLQCRVQGPGIVEVVL